MQLSIMNILALGKFQQVYFANPHETQGVLRAAIHAIAQYIVVKLNEEN